jgi:hypothetical protein
VFQRASNIILSIGFKSYEFPSFVLCSKGDLSKKLKCMHIHHDKHRHYQISTNNGILFHVD